MTIIRDKLKEKERYDQSARVLLNSKIGFSYLGSESIPIFLRTPYLFYEEKIKESIKPQMNVLEIGSGTGLHTYSLIKTGGYVLATDISQSSLQVLKDKFQNVHEEGGSLKTLVADMEQLPFENESFDVVTSAGSLSYGEAQKVDQEIRRVLKPSGLFICVDSLNNNPIYKLNRFIHYLKEDRSKMTLQNMPTFKRLEGLKQNYSELETNFFGSVTYLMPILSRIVGEKSAVAISDKIDNLFRIRKSAFKFALVGRV